MKLKRKPYNLLWLLGIIFLVVSFLPLSKIETPGNTFQQFSWMTLSPFAGNSALDIRLHDTYFVILYQQFLTLVAFCIAGIYMLTARWLFSTVLTWVHVLATMLTLLLVAFADYLPQTYYDQNPAEPLWFKFAT